jgi:hypothetical protein
MYFVGVFRTTNLSSERCLSIGDRNKSSTMLFEIHFTYSPSESPTFFNVSHIHLLLYLLGGKRRPAREADSLTAIA